MLIGIDALNCAQIVVLVVVHLAEPKRVRARWLQHILEFGRLGQPVAVQINGARVMLAGPLGLNQSPWMRSL